MRAVQMQQPGAAETLAVVELDTPDCGPGEVLVRVMAAGVNPIDTKLRARGLYFPDALPAILGCDGAGIVEAVGEGTGNFAVGDEVYYCYGGLGQKSGNYAEYAAVPEVYLAHKPASLDFAAAAAAPLVLITAWEAPACVRGKRYSSMPVPAVSATWRSSWPSWPVARWPPLSVRTKRQLS